MGRAMNLLERVTSFVDRYQLIVADKPIIIGLSGGPDSVFLLHYLMILRESCPFQLIVAHLNHGWRATSDHDEKFCEELAQQFGLSFASRHAREFIDQVPWTGSKEEQARLIRRLFFEQLIHDNPGARVALAHHQDDQYETFFIRLVRGAGLQGLRGMIPHAEQYIRPLLCVRKEEIVSYLHEHNIHYVIDSTNADAVHLRNRIRHQVIPALRTCDERFSVSFQQTINNLAEADDFCTSIAEQTLVQLTMQHDNKSWVDITRFLALHPFLQKQVILRWLCSAQVPFVPSQGLFHEILRFLQQPQGGVHQIHRNWHIHKQQKRAIIHRY
jgi:tRNA(Ile)-lysidine synthase